MAVAVVSELHAIKTQPKGARSKLPRGVRRLPDGRLMIYATNSRHKGVRLTVSWDCLRDLGVEVDEKNTMEQPGVKLAKDALVALKGKLNAERKAGVVRATAKVKVATCYQLVLDEYQRLRRKSLRDLKSRWKNHLRDAFGDVIVGQLTTDMLKHYVRARLDEGAAGGTVNRELAILKHSLKLGAETTPPLVTTMPKFAMLAEANARQGFLTDTAYDRLAQECMKEGLWLRGMLSVGCSFAWRKGEVLNLQVRQLDFTGRVIRLDFGTTKNDDGRIVRMTTEVAELLTACAAGKDDQDFVFTRDSNRRVLDFRTAWTNACERAGCSGLLFHDLRRTGARNLRRLGVSEGVIMKMGGWRTRTVFDRYNIIDDADLADAASRLDQKRAAMDAEKNAETGRKPDEMERLQ
jgi:integrase